MRTQLWVQAAGNKEQDYESLPEALGKNLLALNWQPPGLAKGNLQRNLFQV